MSFQSVQAADWIVSASTGVNSPSSGSMSQPFKTISYALRYTAPNDTVYVLPGTYGISNDLMSGSGISDYDSFGIEIPHDNLTIVGLTGGPGSYGLPVIPSSLAEYQSHNEAYWASQFPTIEGFSRSHISGEVVSRGNSCFRINVTDFAVGKGIYSFNRSGVTVSGLRIKNFDDGVFIRGGSNNSFSHLLLDGFGEPRMVPIVDGANQPTGDMDECDYLGHGLIMMQSAGSTASYCFLLDAEAEGFTLSGSDMTLSHCQAHCTRWFGDPDANTLKGMDYSFLISASKSYVAEDNVIENCVTTQQDEYNGYELYSGHGFSIVCNDFEFDATENEIVDCKSFARGCNYEIRGSLAHENTIKDCYAHRGTRGFCFFGGADDNTFERCESFFVSSAIRSGGPLYNWSADPPEGGDYIATGNTFRNCALNSWSVAFDNSGTQKTLFTKFVNCTFNGDWTGDDNQTNANYTNGRRTKLLSTHSQNNYMYFVNCIITNFKEYKTASTNSTNPSFHNCCIYHNVEFDSSADMTGAGASLVGTTQWDDPLLVQSATLDYQLNEMDYHIQPIVGLQASAAFQTGITRANMQASFFLGDTNDIDQEYGPHDIGSDPNIYRYDIGCDEYWP